MTQPVSARWAISAWRNDDVFEVPVRVRGLDLSGMTLAMQIRLAPDTPDAPLVDLGKVTTTNTQGLRVAGVITIDGVVTSDLRIRINKTTLRDLPYSGEVGDASTLAYALLIAGRTRLEGPFAVLAHAFGSDAAPANRPAGYAGRSAASAAPSGGATLTVSADGGVELTIDGADLLGPLAVDAGAARDAAEDARDQAVAAAASVPAQLAGQTYWGAFTLAPPEMVTGQANVGYADARPLLPGPMSAYAHRVVGAGVYNLMVVRIDASRTITAVMSTYELDAADGINSLSGWTYSVPDDGGTYLFVSRQTFSFSAGPVYHPRDGATLLRIEGRGAGNPPKVGDQFLAAPGIELLVRATFDTPAKGSLQQQIDALAKGAGTDFGRAVRARFAAVAASGGSICFVGDSLMEGFNATSLAKGWTDIVAAAIWGSLDPKSLVSFTNGEPGLGGDGHTFAWYGLTASSGVTYDANTGPIAHCVVMPAGSYLEWTGDFDRINYVFDRASNYGSLTLARNGSVVDTASTAGASAKDVARAPIAVTAGSATYRLTASGGTVYLTNLFRVGAANKAVPRFQRFALAGGASNLLTPDRLASQVKNARLGMTASASTPLFLVGVGINYAVGQNGVARTPAVMRAELAAALGYYKANGYVRQIGMIRPDLSVWPVQQAPDGVTYAFEDYQAAQALACEDAGVALIVVDDIDFAASGLLKDGLHPNDAGHARIASTVMRSLS